MVEKPIEIGIDDLIRKMTLEERTYRHRCVEAWSMAIAWTGFPFAKLVDFAKPLGSAKYVRMETFMEPKVAPGQRQTWYPWPYVEGLTMAEATNERRLPRHRRLRQAGVQAAGAPCGWRCRGNTASSRSSRSCASASPTSARRACGRRCVVGIRLLGQVNPAVPHPRWSQATEEVIGTGARVPTQIFNGYGEYVAALYKGLDKERLWA